MEMGVDEKIKLALQECGGIWCYDIDNKFKYIYPFTTENITGYINQFDLKDKSLLTVGSSGDQVLNAILHDCKDISVIDLCPFAKEYFYLKKAAIEVFNREEYLNYFCYMIYNKKHNNHNAFCKYEYNKIREVLNTYDEEVAYFWNALYNHYKGLRLRKRLFSLDEISINYLSILNDYLISDIAYQELKNKKDKANVTYEIGNLFNVDILRRFDYINLSNIFDYSSLEKFKELIDKMIKCLNDDGILLIAYLYLFSIDKYDPNKKLMIDKLKEILPDDVNSFAFDSVSGIIDGVNSIDSIVTYKKVKKIEK